MKVAFHSNQLGVRGTEVAMFDYADCNESILGNESYILTGINPDDTNRNTFTLDKFRARFDDKLLFYKSMADIEAYIDEHSIDAVYWIIAGTDEIALPRNVKNLIHVVFELGTIFGDRYAFVSEWLSEKFKVNGRRLPFVPHIITLPETGANLREELGIPYDALVVGRHGGGNTFDIDYAKKAVSYAVKKRKDICFLFLGTDRFIDHERVMFLPQTYDMLRKRMFINSCDYMLHARKAGETFGLSIGEFLFCDVPVITCDCGVDMHHKNMLKDKGIYYTGYRMLRSILVSLEKRQTAGEYRRLVDRFSPAEVMTVFDRVFLSGL
jgi:glycosyltransferase involved in cell wall biosynthesis